MFDKELPDPPRTGGGRAQNSSKNFAKSFRKLLRLPEGRDDRLAARHAKKLGLVIDLDTCVGCQACVTACKGWNDAGIGLSDQDSYGADPSGTFLNRVHSYQVAVPEAPAQVVTFPAVLPALRRGTLRHGLPDRGQLQAGRGRHRAGERGRLHRLWVVRLGLSLWRARDGCAIRA
jgi:NAD-dependent dihydropyrimidine dehydrogenase PreA subunit